MHASALLGLLNTILTTTWWHLCSYPDVLSSLVVRWVEYTGLAWCCGLSIHLGLRPRTIRKLQVVNQHLPTCHITSSNFNWQSSAPHSACFLLPYEHPSFLSNKTYILICMYNDVEFTPHKHLMELFKAPQLFINLCSPPHSSDLFGQWCLERWTCLPYINWIQFYHMAKNEKCCGNKLWKWFSHVNRCGVSRSQSLTQSLHQYYERVAHLPD